MVYFFNKSFSQFETSKFINKNSTLWLDINELGLLLNSSLDSIDASIIEVIPMLLLLNELFKYDYYSSTLNLIESNCFYANFFFILGKIFVF